MSDMRLQHELEDTKEALAEALAALEPIVQALEKTSPDILTTGRGYNMGDGEMARIVLPVGDARRAAEVLEKMR